MSFSVSGLSGSGLDVNQIVKSLMDVERVPYTNLQTKKTQLQSEQAVFRQINTKLNVLDTALTELKFFSNMKAYKATSSSEAVTASISSNALLGNYSLTDIKVAKEAEAKTTGTDLIASIKSGDLKIGDIDFSDSALRARLGINANANNDTILNNVINYVNMNVDKAKATMTRVNISADEQSIVFKSQTSDPVEITSNGLTLDRTNGEPASFKVNGENFTHNSNTISHVIPGVTFALSSDAPSATIKVENDMSQVVNKIDNFVKAYNDVVSSVRLNLAKPADEDSINPLQGDTLLKDINDKLYTVFNKLAPGGFMEDIGLSIDKGVVKASGMTGKITFDKEVFSAAMAENAQKVTSIIENVSDEMSSTIFKSWTSYTSGVISTKITGYDAEIKMTDERLESMDRSLSMKEARLKLQFNTMETMLGSLNRTQEWLTQQFSALTKKSE